MAEAELLRDLVESAEAMRAFLGSEDRFRSLVDAFRAKDVDTFHRLLAEAQLVERCEQLCHWLRSKECVLLCLELCGPPVQEEMPDHREFAQVVARITADEELVERLAYVVEERDGAGFKALVSELKIERFCHMLCHWVCSIHYRLICQVVCASDRAPRVSLVNELTQAGEVVGKLAANEKAYSEAAKAALIASCDGLRGAVERAGLTDHCRFICEWFCSLRCIQACLFLCRPFPFERFENPLSEAFEFAQATARLAAQPAALERLADAVVDADPEAFRAIVDELEFGRFCIQLCHWICFSHCQRFCRCVCPPAPLRPWFTHVGHFNITTDIGPNLASPTTLPGRTNKSLNPPYMNLFFRGGGPGFAFFDCLELRGFCPRTSPTFPGDPMRYRFLYKPAVGTPVPLTADLLCAVDAGSRVVPWPTQDASGNATATNAPTFQSMTIGGPATSEAPPPAAGDPWYGPSMHVIHPDGDGWIVVDPLAVAGGFTTLIGFDTNTVVPGGSELSAVLAAGSPVPAPEQKTGTALGIIFEATRVAGPTAPPDFTNSLPTIYINNWDEVNLLNILQFHNAAGATPCSPITTDLDVEYTTDHEMMQEWSATITSASGSAPSGAIASGSTPRGAAGTQHEDTSGWHACSYIVHLSTITRRTTGLVDDAGVTQELSFCIE